MAQSEIEIKVSVEEALHKTMSEFAMKYFEDYGVMINCIDFGWNKTLGGKNFIFQVNVETSSNG